MLVHGTSNGGQLRYGRGVNLRDVAVMVGASISAFALGALAVSSKSLAERNLPRKGSSKRWSLAYKRSIDCRHPKGFSQKNYCARKARGGHYLG